MPATGTKIADSFVAIAADLSGYNAGIKEAEATAGTLGQRIKASLAGAFDRSTVIGLTRDLAAGRAGMRDIADEAKYLGANLKAALRTEGAKALHATLSGVKSVLGGIGGALKEVGKGLLLGVGLGGGLAITRWVEDAVRAIPDLVSRGKDYAQTVHQIALTSGESAEEASRLASALIYLGVPAQDVVNRLGRLSVAVSSNETELNAYGIATRDAAGHMLRSTQVLENMRAVFSKLPTDVAKTRLEILGFGRGGLELADYLTQPDEAIRTLAADAQAAGTILSESQMQAGENVTRAWGHIEVSLTGLANTLFQTLAPTIISVFDGIAGAIRDNAATISAAVESVIGWILGLVSALAGVDLSARSFTTALGGMSAGTSDTSSLLVSLNLQLADLDAKNKKGTSSTKDQTTALGSESKAIDKQIAAVKELGVVQDRTYKAGQAALNAMLDAQLRLMDAQDEARNRAKEDADLQRALQGARDQLVAAQEELRTAGAGATVEQRGKAIEAADAIAAAQQAITDAAARRAEADRRAQIQGVKDFISAIDKVVGDEGLSSASKALRLKRQEDALRQVGAGAAPAGSDMAIELAAVLAAEKRVRDQAANDRKLSELEIRKAQLAAETAAVKTASDDQYQAKRKDLLKLIADEKKRIADAKIADAALHRDLRDNAMGTYGEGGVWSEALEEAKQKGIDFAEEMKKQFGGLADVLKAVSIDGFVDSIKEGVAWIGSHLPAIGWLLLPFGVATRNLGLIGAGLWAIGQKGFNLTETLTGADQPKKLGPPAPTVSPYNPDWQKTPIPGQAAGGWVGLHGPELSWLGEKGPEFVVPNHAIPAFAAVASAGSASRGPIVFQAVLPNGRVLAEFMSEEWTLLPRR